MKKLEDLSIGEENVFVIAELSANHNNDFEIAVKTVEAMAKSGADAVKIQTFTPDSLTLDVDNEYFGPKKDGLWKGRRPYELFQEAMMPWEWQPKLKKVADDLGIVFFSSPFDMKAVDFLDGMNVPAYKIASLEISDIPLIKYTASKKKPIIMSTGVAGLSDIELAVETCRSVGNNDITLLKCTSEYPAPINMADLRTIPNIKDTFNVKVGLSDHTMGSTVPVVAVALGARVVEKHFILDRSMGGADSGFSMEPDEFKFMVKSVREAELALGEVSYKVSSKSKIRRRSLFVTEDIKKGEKLTLENVRSVRPGNGLEPKFLEDALGKIALNDIERGTPLSKNHYN